MNRYQLLKFTEKYFALSQTCTQTRTEIQHLLPRPAYYFSSPHTLRDFLGDYDFGVTHFDLNEQTLRLLWDASNVILGVSKYDAAGPLLKVAFAIPRPFDTVFVNEWKAGSYLKECVQIWRHLMHRCR
jgi:hypothetical protein